MPDPVLTLRPSEAVEVQAPTGEVVRVENREERRVTLAVTAPEGWPIRRRPRQGGDDEARNETGEGQE